MADEKNGGGSVDELLKKLRLQVNQLGEAFGIDSDDAKSNTENTASDDASPENTPPKPKMTTDELLRSLAKTLEPREEALPEAPTEQVVTESCEETEASPPAGEATTLVAEETPPVLPQADEPLEQIDFFEAFDAAPAASPATEALPDAPETEEELLSLIRIDDRASFEED